MASLAGSFLVARTSLRDPNFSRTVVLLLAHGAEGAYGLVVNRAVPAKGLPFPIYLGGPCESPGFVMLHGHPDWAEAAAEDEPGREVAPGVHVGDAACLERIKDLTSEQSLRFRVFRGYSGWGPGQLEAELAQGAWELVPASAELLFDTPVDDLWTNLAPPAFPQPSLN